MKMRVIIVGAGPAGLFCAYELANAGIPSLIIEEGKEIDKRKCPKEGVGYCVKCRVCHFIHGIGGSGLFSDGKLNLNPEIGGNLLEFLPKEEANKLMFYVEKVFEEHGAGDGRSVIDAKAEELSRRAKKAGVRFIPILQRHIGSDYLPKVIKSIENEMKKKGVEFLLETKVRNVIVKNGEVKGVIVGRKKISSDFVVLAPGRGGAHWLGKLSKKLNIPTKYQPIDIGVRVEVPAEIMEEVTSIAWDPKFHIRTKHYDDFVRTFCTNPHGFVISENYGDFVCVNGHSMRGKKSPNTNFAFLVRVALTEPVENTIQYGESIARMATTIGGGKPIIQRLGDLKHARRSTWERIEKSYINATFKYATPGDISMTLPARIVTDILEGLEALNKVIPGVAEDSTLMYSPEIKFHAMRVKVSKNMETNIANLFAVGDGAGVSRGIIGAAVTGLIAAKEIAGRIHG